MRVELAGCAGDVYGGGIVCGGEYVIAAGELEVWCVIGCLGVSDWRVDGE